MNPVQQIGRYSLPLLSVVAIRRRRGWRLWLIKRFVERFNLLYEPNVYDVLLNNGHTLRFTETEKEKYGEALEWHSITMQWYGAARGVGLRG
jgi:hypothetical protein